MYRIFDFSLACDISLPELPETVNGGTVIKIQRGQQKAGETKWVHEWKDKDGEVCIRYGRAGNDFMLQFPEACDFLVSGSGDAVRYFPEANVPEEMVRHLLLDQVIPRLASHKGQLVVHASAVIHDGKAIIFLGDTGSGKSTLAAGFFMQSYEILTDDCILLSPEGNGTTCIPCYPGIRLWKDSYNAVVNDDRYLSNISYRTDKQRLILQNAKSARQNHSVPLAAVFILDDATRPRQDAGISVMPVSGAIAAMDIIRQSFVLDVHDKGNTGVLFAIASGIANSGLQIYRLGYPSDFGMLNEVLAEILKAVKD